MSSMFRNGQWLYVQDIICRLMPHLVQLVVEIIIIVLVVPLRLLLPKIKGEVLFGPVIILLAVHQLRVQVKKPA